MHEQYLTSASLSKFCFFTSDAISSHAQQFSKALLRKVV